MPKATRQSFGEALAAVAEKDPRVVVLDADLAKSTGTGPFLKKFPSRHLEFGIAEQNMIGAAAGLALAGKVPVAASFACFLVNRLETIRVAVSYNKTNVKLAGTHAGIGIGDDGTSQMGLEDVAAMRALPHMTVLQPADDLEARQMTEWMVAHDGPVYLRLTRQPVSDVHAAGYSFALGKADTVFEPAAAKGGQGKLQATVFASGGTVGPAVDAAKSLAGRGFRARVVNAGTLMPFDAESVVRAAADSQRIVTVEDHNVTGGLGSAVCEALAERGAACRVVRLGLTSFGESASGPELYEKYGLSAAHIVEACLKNLD